MSIYCIFRGLGEFKKDAKPFANVEVRKKTWVKMPFIQNSKPLLAYITTAGTGPVEQVHSTLYIYHLPSLFSWLCFFFIMDTNRCMRSGLIWIMCYLLLGNIIC